MSEEKKKTLSEEHLEAVSGGQNEIKIDFPAREPLGSEVHLYQQHVEEAQFVLPNGSVDDLVIRIR